MPGLRKTIRRARDFAALGSLYLLTRPLSFRALQRVGRGLGVLCYHVIPVRKAVVLANLEAAFGDTLDSRAIRDLARRFYACLGTTLLEFYGLGRLRPERLRTLVDIEGREHLDAALAGGKGALLVSGHFGNWELLASAIVALGYPTRFVTKSQSNPLVDRMQARIRGQAGVGMIRTDGSLVDIIRVLRRGEFIGILGDQDAGLSGQFVNFLGRPASVFRGTARFAYRLQCPIVTGGIVRQPDGRHRVVLGAPIHVDPAWDEETAIRELTEKHTQRLEALVRRWPDHYFWVHRRWKTQPPKETP